MTAPDDETIDRLRSAMLRITRRIDRQLGGGGLTRTQLSVLAAVANQGPIGLSELASYEGLNPTMLSRVVSKLEDDGLIRRLVDQADRRAARVEVTRAGVRLRSRLFAERSAILRARMAELPDDAVARLIAVVPALEELAANLDTSVRVRT